MGIWQAHAGGRMRWSCRGASQILLCLRADIGAGTTLVLRERAPELPGVVSAILFRVGPGSAPHPRNAVRSAREAFMPSSRCKSSRNGAHPAAPLAHAYPELPVRCQSRNALVIPHVVSWLQTPACPRATATCPAGSRGRESWILRDRQAWARVKYEGRFCCWSTAVAADRTALIAARCAAARCCRWWWWWWRWWWEV
eukprot:361570-Chlamydomonas_euryale.AAC.7